MRRLGIALILVCLIFTMRSAFADEVNVVNSQFQVAAGKSACTALNVSSSASAAKILGTATASGGSHNDIRVLVIKDQKEIVYDSGRLQAARLNIQLKQPGPYAVCFDNTFSLVSPKTVRASIKLVIDTRVNNLTLGFAAGIGALGALGDVVDGKPIDQAVGRGLNQADGIFNDINWVRLRGYQQGAPRLASRDPNGGRAKSKSRNRLCE